VNPIKGKLHILNVTNNRVIQTAAIDGEPDQVTYSNTLAYIRRRKSDTVLMIALSQIGIEGKAISVADFPAGQHPLGDDPETSPADSIVKAPGENAVLVANPKDKSIYYYTEGMAAPMGSFNNYGQEPRAVLVVDRSLREQEPGVYSSVGRLGAAGVYDLALLMDSPRVVQCFEVQVQPDPAVEARNASEAIAIDYITKDLLVKEGGTVSLKFRLVNPKTGRVWTGLKDVQVLAFLSPGVWQKRDWAKETTGGVYTIDITPPRAGIYYVYIASETVGLGLNNPQYYVLDVKSSTEKKP